MSNMLLSLLPIIGMVAAQPITDTSSGALPAGVSLPNTLGFQNPVILPSRGGYAICVSGNVPVTASGMNLKLNYTLPKNQSDVAGTTVDLISQSSDLTRYLVSGLESVSGTYNIGASLCIPAKGTNSSAIQILTHGVGFDRYYWDFAPGYSYVDFAAQKGYATFLYDRLGVGASSKPDPIRELQAPLQVGILAELIRKLRAGAIGGTAVRNIVGVGHSYGSIITQGVTNFYPNLTDAVVLTGFSTNSSGNAAFLTGLNLEIASENQPYRFSVLNNGYLVSSSATSTQIAFFKTPNFDPQIVAQADAQKGTESFGEFFSQSAVVNRTTEYRGPVAFVNGANDLPFCYGNCLVPEDKTAITRARLYPAARNTTNPIFNVPQTGHGINLHYSANTAYQFIQNFIKASGY